LCAKSEAGAKATHHPAKAVASEQNIRPQAVGQIMLPEVQRLQVSMTGL